MVNTDPDAWESSGSNRPDRRRMPAWAIRTVADTGGPHPGTRTDTIWWSPALALPLRWEIDMGIRGVFSLTTRARLTLASTTPEV